MRTKKTERELILGLKQGGTEQEYVVRHLLKSHVGIVFKVRGRLGLSKEEANDVFADAILELIDVIRRDKFREQARISTFLFRVAYNKGMDLIKKSFRRKEVSYLDLKDFIVSDEGPDKQLIRSEEIEFLYKKLGLLGKKCQHLLRLRFFWNYKMEDIAEMTGASSPATARQQHYRCLQKLRTYYQKQS